MLIKRFNASTMATPKVPLSHGVVAGDWLHISGMVARTLAGEILEDPAAATRQCLANMEAVLADVGATRDHVVKVQVYLADFADFGAMNGEFSAFFGAEPPARTTIQAGALGIGIVELDAVAYVAGLGA